VLPGGNVPASPETATATWPLVSVHLRERHPDVRAAVGGFPFAPHALGWFLAARYRRIADPNLRFLAIPGWLAVWIVLIGVASCLISKLFSASA